MGLRGGGWKGGWRGYVEVYNARNEVKGRRKASSSSRPSRHRIQLFSKRSQQLFLFL